MPGAPGTGVRPDAHGPTRWLWWANSAAFVIAAIALTWLVAAVGPATVAGVVRSAAGAITVVIALELVVLMLRARATHVLLRPSQRMISFQRVVATQAAAATVQDLTPTGALGDVVKATMLLARAPATEVVSAIVAYDILSVYVSGFVVTVGILVTASLGIVPPPLDQALWATAVALLVLVLIISWLIRRGLATTVLGAVTRGRWADRLATLDQRLRELHGRDRAEPRQAFLFLLLARMVGWIELYVLLRAVGVAPSAGVFVVLILGQMPVSRLSTLLPLGAGISDLGTAGLFALLGLPAQSGLAVAMLSRVRQVIIGVLALLVMIVLQALDRITLARTRSRLRRALIPVALLVAACSDSSSPPEPSSGRAGDAECAGDQDCALLPYVTCCGECPPEPPYEAGSRQELDAIFIELESRCGLDRRACEPPVCVPRPAGCYVRATCRGGECVAETDGPCGVSGSAR